jgi:hypothetical protein
VTSSGAEDALQGIWGLSGLAVDHDQLTDATDTSCRPSDPVVAALVAMKEAIDGFHAEEDSWLDYPRSAGRDPKSP